MNFYLVKHTKWQYYFKKIPWKWSVTIKKRKTQSLLHTVLSKCALKLPQLHQNGFRPATMQYSLIQDHRTHFVCFVRDRARNPLTWSKWISVLHGNTNFNNLKSPLTFVNNTHLWNFYQRVYQVWVNWDGNLWYLPKETWNNNKETYWTQDDICFSLLNLEPKIICK